MTAPGFDEMFGGMRSMVNRPIADPRVNGLMLSDLGQKVLNAIGATRVLGHSRLAHTNVYVHSDDAAVELITAVLDGEIDTVTAALDRWWIEAEAKASAEVAAFDAAQRRTA